MKSEAQDMLKQAAQKMRQLDTAVKTHEKRAHALRLLYKQAELGYGEVPRSYDELQTKIASLLNQDLQVLEKALELTGGNVKLGELDRNSIDPSMHSALEMFQATIITGE